MLRDPAADVAQRDYGFRRLVMLWAVIAVTALLMNPGLARAGDGPALADLGTLVAWIANAPVSCVRLVQGGGRDAMGTAKSVYGVGSERFSVFVQQQTSTVVVLRTNRTRGAIGVAIPSEEQLQVATGLVKKCWGLAAGGLRLVKDAPIMDGLHLFVWTREVSPGVLTGDVATVIVTADGRISSYSERRALCGVDPAAVKVQRPTAEAIGARLTAKHAPLGAKFELQSSALVLSSPLVPGQGPAWEMIYSKAAAPSVPPVMVVIDAMTGQEIRCILP
jgi:hypothetical protein